MSEPHKFMYFMLSMLLFDFMISCDIYSYDIATIIFERNFFSKVGEIFKIVSALDYIAPNYILELYRHFID